MRRAAYGLEAADFGAQTFVVPLVQTFVAVVPVGSISYGLYRYGLYHIGMAYIGIAYIGMAYIGMAYGMEEVPGPVSLWSI